MVEDTLREALDTLRAFDDLRRALPPGSRDRLLIEADLDTLDRAIRAWVAADPSVERTAALKAAVDGIRAHIDST
jgi:hypothetical protein